MAPSKKEARLIRVAFLQSLITHRCMTEKYAQQLHRRICHAVNIEPDRDDFANLLDTLATSLNPLDLEVRRTVDQYRAVPVLALVNTKADEIAKVATSYKDAEIKAIFTAPDEAYCVSSMQALRLSNEIKPPMSKKNCEELLDNLIAHQWLVKTRTGRYALSSRSLLELHGYLKNEFPDHLLECSKCHDVVTQGKACSSPDCPVRIHVHCETSLTMRAGTLECPGCQANWATAHPVGEDSVGSGRRPNRRRGAGHDDDEEEEDEDEDEEMMEGDQSGHGAEAVDEDDEDDDDDDDDEDDDDDGPPVRTAASRRGGARVAKTEPASQGAMDEDEVDEIEYVDE
ncbi:uncharacterized protein PSFLO_01742 [Pseudozyma flocculosa]|uniref:Non-structural maintenance of chromosomes element 1 homolog n=1 Tax=Pseudozyma flocculosa TaxID=84751 RepID=A0A5C3EZ15_9BASI|nr:uncharacterized protein PSFLO_01742 [Pseudozyma flocculosa]